MLLLFELLESLRRKSSRSRDFKGDTLIKDGSVKLLDVAPFSSSNPLLFGSCFIGISEIEGVMTCSPSPILNRTTLLFVIREGCSVLASRRLKCSCSYL
jgi:hypothetical protein